MTEPDAVALRVAGVGELTYRTWAERAAAAAAALRAKGLVHGERVALIASNEHLLDYVPIWVGALSLGAVVMPVPIDHGVHGRNDILERGDPVGVVDFAGYSPRLSGARWVARVRDLDFDAPPAAPESVREEDIAQVVFTSGTTGQPRGIVMRHGDLAAACVPEYGAATATANATERASALYAAPLATNGGQVMLMGTLSLRDAITTVVLPDFEPRQYCALIEEHRIAGLMLIPALARWLIQSGEPDRHDLSCVRWVGLSSAPATADLLRGLSRAFVSAQIVNAYTTTEAYPSGVAAMFDESRPTALGLVGDSVRILNDAGRELAAGELGEVCLRATPIRREYFGDSAATAAVFMEGWTRTGDLGYVDADGYLYLMDRKSDSINVGGLKISSLEVESALLEHEHVLDAAVVGMPHALLGQQVVAVIVADTVSAVEHELRAFVAHRLGWQKTPQRVVVVEELPRNNNGKVLKRELRSRVANLPPAPYRQPVGEIERAVAGIWTDILACGPVSADANFFDIGGHSLAATKVLGAIAQNIGVELPLRTVFERPTVVDLALAIEGVRALAEAGGGSPHPPDQANLFTPRVADDVPLASAVPAMQWEQWVEDYVQPGSTNLSLVWWLRGGIDRAALTRVAAELLRRHDVFRTVIAPDDCGIMRLWLRPEAQMRVGEIDLCDWPTDALSLEDRIEQLVHQPIDLASAPLLRVLVACVPGNLEALLVFFPHTCGDDTSVSLLSQEIPELYAAAAAGRAFPPSVQRSSYSEFARAERSWLDSNAGEQALDYWRRTLEGMPLVVQQPVVDLTAADGVSAAEPNMGRNHVVQPIPDDTVSKLRAIAGYHQVSLFIVMLAAFTIQMQRLCGGNDVVVPSLVAGRSGRGHDGTIGFLARSVTLRVDLSGARTFIDVLMRTKEVMISALEHYPAAAETAHLVARDAAVDGLPRTSGIEFQALTATFDPASFGSLEVVEPRLVATTQDEMDGASAGEPRAEVPGAESFQAVIAEHAAPTDMINGTWTGWRVVDRGSEVFISAHGIFARSAMTRVLRGYAALLDSIAMEPGAEVGALHALSTDELALVRPRDAPIKPLLHQAVASILRGDDSASQRPTDVAMLGNLPVAFASDLRRQGLRVHHLPARGPLDAASLAEMAAREEWTGVVSSPQAFSDLMRQVCCEARIGPHPLRVVIVGEECLEAEVVAALRRCVYLNVSAVWGRFSTGRALASGNLSSLGYSRRVVGRALPGSGVLVVDAHGHPCPVGVRGRLTVGEDSPTGFAARLLDDGMIEMMGLEQEWVRHRGYDFQPRRIEAALCEHPAIQDAAVLLRRGAEGRALLTAYVVSKHQMTLTQLRRQVAVCLGAYATPAAAVRVLEIPRHDGRVLVDDLPLPVTDVPGHQFPRTERERILCDILRDLLGRDVSADEEVLWAVACHPRPSVLVELCLRAQTAGIPLTIIDAVTSPVATVATLARLGMDAASV